MLETPGPDAVCYTCAVALAFQAQLLPSVAMSQHDETIDVLVTSEGAVFQRNVS